MNDVLITSLLSTQLVLCFRELLLPEVTSPVGSVLQPDTSLCVDKGGSHLLPQTAAPSEHRKVDSSGVADLTKALFQTSYDERMRKVGRASCLTCW